MRRLAGLLAWTIAALFLLALRPGAASAAEPRGGVVALAATTATGAAATATLHGRVVGITDGDTITVLVGRKPLKVRLLEIDAPEHSQPWGDRSKQALSALVFARPVELRTRGTDRYGRTLARVYVGSLDVSATMVRSGSAWAFRRYLTDRSILRLEADARRAQRGLWSLPKAQVVAPWEWRQTAGDTFRRPRDAEPKALFTTAGACAGKHLCRQMTSCAEAQHYLRACGVSSLDRDGDGIACETLCAGDQR
jgi:endonuclease YncB( thermonuclease family)